MNTDKRGTKILTRTFFTQLQASGYTSNQIIGIATELIDLVADDIRDGDKAEVMSRLSPEAEMLQAV